MDPNHGRGFDDCPAGRSRRRRGAHRVWKGGGRLRLVVAAAVVTSAVVGAGASFGAGSGTSDAPAASGGFDVSDYDVTVSYQPDTRALRGVTVVSAMAGDALNSVILSLGGLTVRSVTVDSEAAKSFSQTDRNLVVVPAKTIARGARFAVRVEYDGTPGENDGWQTTKSGGAATVEGDKNAWFPSDYGADDRANFRLTATVPQGWSVVSNGQESPPRDDTATSTFGWSARDVDPRSVTISIDKFTIDRSTLSDGTPVVNAYGPGLEEKTKPLGDRLPEIIDFLSGKYGPYPFEAAGDVFLDEDDFGPGTAPQTRPVFFGAANQQYMNVDAIVHEQTHQWYGDTTYPRTPEDDCLSECFAVYSTWLWDEAKNGVDLDARYREQLNAEKSDDKTWAVLYQPGKTWHLNEYSKGPLALHALRRLVGAEAFDRLLKQWPQEHRGDYVDWPEFETFAQKVTGQDLTGFFQAWFRSSGVPADQYLWPGSLKP